MASLFINLLPAIFLSLLGCVFVCLFFKYYGVFKMPWYVWISLLFQISISIVETFGLLPYDVSLCLFGQSTNEDNYTLWLVLTILYWTSWLLGWIFMPIMVNMYSYTFALTWKSRVLYSIRYNLIFYAIALVVIIIGVVILLTTTGMTINDLLPLAKALSNAYGLVVLCISFGYGFFALPRFLWKTASHSFNFDFHLYCIQQEYKQYEQYYCDAKEAMRYCEESKNRIMTYYKELFTKNVTLRIDQLNNLINDNVVAASQSTYGIQPNKKIKELSKINWNSVYIPESEKFFMVIDDTIKNLRRSTNFIKYHIDTCEKELKSNTSDCKINSRLVFQRLFAIFIFLICMVCLWGEIVLMFNPKLSVFYIISHQNIDRFTNQLFITAPVIGFLLYIGSWTLTKVRLFNYYRFIPGATDDNTIYFWVVVLARIAPSIGYHYLLQIGAENSMTVAVLGDMKKVAFLGTSWNYFSPILIIVVGICVIFSVWDRILLALGEEKFTFDESLRGNVNCSRGKEILLDNRPELGAVLKEQNKISGERLLDNLI